MSFLFIVCVVSVVKATAERIKKSKQFETDPKIKMLSTLNDLYKDIDNVSARIFYCKMSKILRTYASKHYNFNAVGMTTSEFFDKIKRLLFRMK
jgi:predicted peroxiredoxin